MQQLQTTTVEISLTWSHLKASHHDSLPIHWIDSLLHSFHSYIIISAFFLHLIFTNLYYYYYY